ncbi:hypothetical protein PF005_g5303 [Phytophthora fragariae]|uniref:Phosphatidate phosphatase APP1 catalytic domain-containing protein n=2 Tax=Phytophthora fragariae TaxID=53985 RepID=A0A6A3UQ59_9STRA|nr:hypothetical protein PF003_g16483 [Phytophthora fragariae]KAE8946568.1 hypothetical protein PF009_g3797 [Phytophthora fragariae]KAE9022913.1 hypothetical protein PF011_g4239 [Phytophthora fragariae]KAE9131448.1 hypothetical protein PF007_g4148 [Phytophthora fragariae]KAE9132157.1 hypothetical protein PF010_g3285 [Phytophthora fragariae]
MERMRELELSLPFLVLFLLLLCVCAALLFHGVDPLRVLRSSFKAPQRPRVSLSGSDGEREALLAVDRKARVRYTGKVPLYTDTIAELAACETPRETEAFIKLIDVHRLLNSKVKAQHFAHFCSSRLELPVLGVSTLATIVLSLQKYAAEPDVVTCIRDCFCAKRNMACLQLKNKVDAKFPMFDLIYHRIRSDTEREAILKHFEAEAAALRASSKFFAPIKLLCDIDDTMLAALFDTRYPELTVYPGVHQFAQELLRRSATIAADSADRHSGYEREDSDEDEDLESGNTGGSKKFKEVQRVAFLTARPEFLRKRSLHELRACGFQHFTLLMGRFANMWGSQRIASGKLRNFVRFKRVFAEHRFVFVGDNGQGDIDLGKELLKNPHLYAVSAVLIHDIIRNHATEKLSQHSYRGKECNQNGIHSFRTYIGASFHLYMLGLLPLSSVVRVVEKTALAYAAIVFDTRKQKQNLAQEILADVAAVVNELPDQQAMALVSSLHDDLVGSGDDDETENNSEQQSEKLTREQQLQQRLEAVRKNAAKPMPLSPNVQETV